MNRADRGRILVAVSWAVNCLAIGSLGLRDNPRVLHPFRALGLAVGRPSIPLTEALDLAETAERAGFAIIGAGEGFFENFALMGALTQRTRSAELRGADRRLSAPDERPALQLRLRHIPNVDIRAE